MTSADSFRGAHRLSLGQLFLLWMLVALILTLALTSALVLARQHHEARRALAGRARAIAPMLALAAAGDDAPASAALRIVPEVRAVEVVAAQGEVVFRFGPFPARNPPPESDLEVLVEEVRRPVDGSTVEVVVAVSHATLRTQVLAAGVRLVAVLAAVLAAALVSGAFLVHRITAPLTALAERMRRFAPGETEPLTDVDPGAAAEVAALAHSFRDMTSRLDAQQRSMAASERRFRELFETSPTPLLVVEPGGELRDFNPAAEPFLGAALPGACATHLALLVEPEPQPEELRRAAVEGVPLERRWRVPDAERAEVQLHVRPLEGDGPRGFLVAVHDVTDRVRRLGERWRRTFDAMDDGVAVLGPDGGVEIANRAFTALAPVLAGELEGLRGRPAPAEWERELGGRIFRLAVSAARELGGTVLVVRDVTQAVRTATQLREAQKMEAIATLASGVAHDFNNLLAGVLLHVRVLERDPGSLAESAGAIRELAEGGAEAVRELLLYARREAAPRRALDLGAEVRGQRSFLARLLPAAVELELWVEEAPVPVLASPGELRRVLLNLVLNARDAIGAARGTIGVAVRREAGWALVEVRDSGSGIAPEHVQRIFEPFFTTGSAGGRTGLGLAAVQAVVREHGGTIEVESAPGAGTLVLIRLPLRDDLEPEADDPEQALPVAGSERVLVVEDEARLAERMVAELEATGYRVRHATTLAVARRLASDEAPEVVITDLLLPDGSGADLVGELRRVLPELPVVVCTGTRAAAVDAGLGAGERTSVVAKPFTIELLLLELRRLLDGARPG